MSNFLAQIGELMPGVLGALVVLLIGWFIARGVKRLSSRLLSKSGLDERINRNSSKPVKASAMISKLVYYVVLTLVLMVVLEMLGVSQILDPLKQMVAEFVGYIPNLVAALIIGFAGYVIASIASELVNMAGNFLENVSAKAGFSASIDLSNIAKRIVFLFVFIPVLIVALDALQIKTISEPAKEMLSSFINAIPNILAAAITLAVFYIGGRFLTAWLRELLVSLGADQLPRRLDLTSILGEKQKMSVLIANAVFFFLMFGGIIAAVNYLEMPEFAAMLENLLAMISKIFFGLMVLVVGNFVSKIAHKSLANGEDTFLASIARVAILGLFLAISLRTMGIANEIVTLAFGLTLGSVAVAVALAFGLGGRKAGGRQMEYILSRFRPTNTNGHANASTKQFTVDTKVES
ncbi:MAG: mechanosensitive ion channel [Bacteroidota bacterium]